MEYEKGEYKKIELSHYELQIILAVLSAEVNLTADKANEIGLDNIKRWYNKRNVNDTRLTIMSQCQRLEEAMHNE